MIRLFLVLLLLGTAIMPVRAQDEMSIDVSDHEKFQVLIGRISDFRVTGAVADNGGLHFQAEVEYNVTISLAIDREGSEGSVLKFTQWEHLPEHASRSLGRKVLLVVDAADHRRVERVLLAKEHFCVNPKDYEAEGWADLDYSAGAIGNRCFEAIAN